MIAASSGSVSKAIKAVGSTLPSLEIVDGECMASLVDIYGSDDEAEGCYGVEEYLREGRCRQTLFEVLKDSNGKLIESNEAIANFIQIKENELEEIKCAKAIWKKSSVVGSDLGDSVVRNPAPEDSPVLCPSTISTGDTCPPVLEGMADDTTVTGFDEAKESDPLSLPSSSKQPNLQGRILPRSFCDPSCSNLPPAQASKTRPSVQPRNAGSWASVASDNSPPLPFTFVDPSFNKINKNIVLPTGSSSLGEALWKNTLVGFFIVKRLSLHILLARVRVLWSNFGLREVISNRDGFLFFTFTSKEGCENVLKKGPWVVMGQALHLKAWNREFDFKKEEFKTIPVWVKLYGIPSTYWSSDGLSAIASRLGIPLYADGITAKANRLEFARICVEMKVGSDFPLFFGVDTEYGETFEVRVEYSWRPLQCSHCNVFGHSSAKCPKHAPPSSNTNKIHAHIAKTPTPNHKTAADQPSDIPHKPIPPNKTTQSAVTHIKPAVIPSIKATVSNISSNSPSPNIIIQSAEIHKPRRPCTPYHPSTKSFSTTFKTSNTNLFDILRDVGEEINDLDIGMWGTDVVSLP